MLTDRMILKIKSFRLTSEIKIFIKTEEKILNKELKDVKQIKNLASARFKAHVKEEKENLQKSKNRLQKIINKISEKSARFKQVISKI